MIRIPQSDASCPGIEFQRIEDWVGAVIAIVPGATSLNHLGVDFEETTVWLLNKKES